VTGVGPGVPFLLEPNPAPQFYAGGGKWVAFRGLPVPPEPSPEDWVGSTTSLWKRAPAGQTVLASGCRLVDAVAAEPSEWLGPAHVERYGADTRVLVKLLDGASRLVVHCHPDRNFARAHLGCAHGKTEAWIVLAAGEDAAVWLGFRRPVDRLELADWVTRQDVPELLGALNRLPVKEGDSILVPAGVPHAIGAGVLVLELQEPEDMSILLERPKEGEGGDLDWHLGLGADLALAAVDGEGWGAERLARLRASVPADQGSALPAAAAPFFRAEHVVAGAVVSPGFRVLVGLAGEGALEPLAGPGGLSMRAGAVALAGAAVGPLRVTGSLRAVVCRPPAPDEGDPPRPEV